MSRALLQPEPVLIRPPSDKDEIETNLEQDRREAWELSVKGDDFSDFYNAEAIGGINGYAMLACCDSFYEGWAAAIAKYSAPPAPEPTSVLWVMTTPIGGRKFVIESESEAKRFAAMGDRSVVPFYAAPITYRHPADDAALKRSFEAMESGIVAELRSELAEMTDNRDIILAEVGRYIRMAKSADADRLDAQRWKFFLTAQDETTPEHAAIISAVVDLYPDDDLSKVMTLAMIGDTK